MICWLWLGPGIFAPFTWSIKHVTFCWWANRLQNTCFITVISLLSHSHSQSFWLYKWELGKKDTLLPSHLWVSGYQSLSNRCVCTWNCLMLRRAREKETDMKQIKFYTHLPKAGVIWYRCDRERHLEIRSKLCRDYDPPKGVVWLLPVWTPWTQCAVSCLCALAVVECYWYYNGNCFQKTHGGPKRFFLNNIENPYIFMH